MGPKLMILHQIGDSKLNSACSLATDGLKQTEVSYCDVNLWICAMILGT